MTDRPHPHPLRCETCEKTFEECCLQKPTNPQPGCWYVGAMLRKAFDYTGCASHSAVSHPAPSPKQWDNRLIWSLENLLQWIRENHPDQMDIRDHIDLLLGTYRNELESIREGEQK